MYIFFPLYRLHSLDFLIFPNYFMFRVLKLGYFLTRLVEAAVLAALSNGLKITD